LGDSVPLANVNVVSPDGAYPNAMAQSFNNEILLAGYAYDRRLLAPGDSLAVTLYWQALQDGARDYIVQQGQAITDTRILVIPPGAPPATYTVEIALLDSASQRRQNIVAPDGHWLADRLLLARIRVE
jgi:hypothetical protein